MKLCSICKTNKSTDSFYKNRKKKDGLQNYCKDCSLKRRIEYYKKNSKYYKAKNKSQVTKARDFIQQAKRKGNCSKCKDDRWYVLDFHHLSKETKLDGLAKMVTRGYSLDNLQKEMEKCILLCANCHRELHHLENIGR